MITKVTGKQVIAKAKTYKGKYNKKVNKFTKYFAGKYGISKAGKMPGGNGYCTLWCGYVLAQLGAFDLIPHTKLKKWWHTQKLLAWYKKHKPAWVVTDPAKAKPGALAFKKCGSTKKKTTGHTAIFEKYKNGMVYTIDGNVGGGVVTRKKAKAWYVAFVNLPYAAEPVKYKVVTSGGNLNVRSKPDSTGKILRKLTNGSLIEVIEIEDGWATLKNGGYCYARFIKKAG